ncbi:MAG: hypothetical protein AAB514_00230 [Patescibacteria group bacterium]
MNKAFPIVIWITAIGIVLYLLPEFAAFFGFESLGQAHLSPVVFVSDDNGKTFDKTYWSGSFAPTVYDFEVDGRDSSFVYAATDQGLFMSRDRGSHWFRYSDLEGQLAKAMIFQIEKSANNPARLFVSAFKNGQGGIYETDDRFFTSRKIFDTKEAVAYKLDSSGDKLYLGLSDGRVISYSLRDAGFRLLAAVGSPITDIVVAGARIYVATLAKEIWTGSVSGNDFVSLKEEQPSQSAYTASLLGANLKTVVAKKPIKTILPDGQGGIYLAAADKLYHSVNQGKSWQLVLDVSGRRVSSLNLESSGRVIVGTGKEKEGNSL